MYCKTGTFQYILDQSDNESGGSSSEEEKGNKIFHL